MASRGKITPFTPIKRKFDATGSIYVRIRGIGKSGEVKLFNLGNHLNLGKGSEPFNLGK